MKEITLKIKFNLYINNLKFLSGYTNILTIKIDLVIETGFSLKNE